MQERHDLVERYLGIKHKILHAFNYDDAVEILNADIAINIGLMCFDRDLGDFITVDGKQVERTGHTIIHYLRENIAQEFWPPRAIVHSYNSEAKYMTEDLVKMGIHTTQQMFSGDLCKQLVIELAEQ